MDFIREIPPERIADASPAGFQVMAKPIGPACNLACDYCYYLEKGALYPGTSNFRMPEKVLDAFIQKYVRAQPIPEVPFVWQGGEPTLLGLGFFRRVVELQTRHGGGRPITNSLQTNGTLLDDDWCEFLARNGFLVGLSLDGPGEIHNRHRRDKGGKPSYDAAMLGLGLLKKHGVEFNALAVVAREHARHPLDVYRFLKSQGVRFMQFLPIVERMPGAIEERMGLRLGGCPSPGEGEDRRAVTPWSVEPEAYGRFLIDIFEEWVRNDVGNVFVMNFEWALSSWMGLPPLACFFMPRCGRCLVMEHNGDLFACDHYVYPAYRLGNILADDLAGVVESARQAAFGAAKETALPRYCLRCPVLRACRGECTKHRFMTTPDGEPGLNYLCGGYKEYFTRISPYLKWLSQTIRSGKKASGIMEMIRASERRG